MDDKHTALNRKSSAPNPEDVRIGARVRARRTELKRSQSWLGECVHVTFQQVQKYEKGLNRISATQLQAFARALAVPTDYFYDTDYSFKPELVKGLGEISGPAYGNESIEADLVRVGQAVRALKDPKISRALAELVEAMQCHKIML